MDINTTIGYLEKTEGLIVPSDVQFASLEIYNQTAESVGWVNRPSNQKLIDTWELIKTDIENERVLSYAKAEKLMNLESAYNNLISQGYTNTNFNITLKLEEYDRNSFAQLLSMLKLAEDLQQSITTVPIADINSQIHSFTLIQLKQLLLLYGFYYQTIWSEFTAKKKQVIDCTNLNDLINL